MAKKPHRILVDCDGVLADFASAALDLIEERTGDRHTHEELVHWDVFKSVDKAHLEHVLQDAVEHEGFCLGLKPFDGARTFMKVLKDRYEEVYILTSPFVAREWVYERTRWLEGHFGIDPRDIVHAKDKKVVFGHALIDDSGKNLRSWGGAWPEGIPILMDAPYNQGDTEFQRGVDYEDIIRVLDARLK